MNFVTVVALAFATLSVVYSQNVNLHHNVRVYPVDALKPPTTTTTTITTPEPTTEAIKIETREWPGSVLPNPIPKWPKDVPASISVVEVLSKSTFTCNGLDDGYFADVDYDCMFFHNCHFFFRDDNRLFVQQAVFKCGDGTRFNQTTRTCDYETLVDCRRSVVKSIIEEQRLAPTPIPGLAVPVEFPKTNFRCDLATRKQGYYYADMEVGCKMYHRCIYYEDEGILFANQYSFLCPDGTSFNQATISCFHSSEVKCQESRLYEDEQAVLHPNYNL